MTKPKQPSDEPSNKRPTASSYEVGYGKPPVSTQFQKGQSGNPNGRPKGSRNKQPAFGEERLQNIILEEAYRIIPIQEQGKTVKIPMAQAVVRSTAVSAAKGNTRSQRLFNTMLAQTEASQRQRKEESVKSAIDYKLACQRELERSERLGKPLPAQIQHPDEIMIDFATGEVRIEPGMIDRDREFQDFRAKQIVKSESRLKALRASLRNAQTEAQRKTIREQIGPIESVLAKLHQHAPKD